MIDFAFLSGLAGAADIVLFMITTIVFLAVLIIGLRLGMANLHMAQRQRNRKALYLTAGAPSVLLVLTAVFNLSPASRTEVFILIALTLGMTYVEAEVNRQLRRRTARRRRR